MDKILGSNPTHVVFDEKISGVYGPLTRKAMISFYEELRSVSRAIRRAKAMKIHGKKPKALRGRP